MKELLIKTVKFIVKILMSLALGITFGVAFIEVPNVLGYSGELLKMMWFRELLVYVCTILGFVYVFKFTEW